jgi:uncharacterized protein (TIGR02996 family)
MSRKQAFLHAIRADPDDDSTRLVYADWLEEHGDPDRAEFIRLQVQRAVLDPHRIIRGWRPKGREAQLLASHEDDWLGHAADWLNNNGAHWAFHRGLIHLEINGRAFLSPDLPRGLEACLRAGWVETLELGMDPEDMAALAASPRLGWVAQLTLGGGAEDISLLAASPHLARLTRLALDHAFIGDEGAVALAASPHLGNLTHLDLECAHLGAVGAVAVATSPVLTRLTHLSLCDNALEADGCQAFLDALRLGQLRSLDLSFCMLRDEGARRLASCSRLAPLVGLDLAYNYLTEAGIEALASSPHLLGLTHLRLDGNEGIGNDGARALAWSAQLSRLASLGLHYCHISEEGAEALAWSPHLASLAKLDLSTNYFLRDDGVRALASTPCWTQLTHLNLRNINLRAEGVRALSACPQLASLQHLVLDDNSMGDEGAQALAATSCLTGLTVLSLDRCHIGGAGAAALLNSVSLGRLSVLNLSNNPGVPDDLSPLLSDRPALRHYARVAELASGAPTEATLPALLGWWNDTDPWVRWQAREGIGRLLKESRELNDTDSRREARRALAGHEQALREALLAALGDTVFADQEVQRRADQEVQRS